MLPEFRGNANLVLGEWEELTIWVVGGFLLGGIAGGLAQHWAAKLTPLDHLETSLTSFRGKTWITAGLTAALTTFFVIAMLHFHCQQTTIVRPDPIWRLGRVGYHGILIWFLVAATITDLRDYVIPDQITIPGTLVGVIGAVSAGDLQMMHLWVDWNAAIPGMRGPDFPAWIAEHHHLHGLAWSLAGLGMGAGVTYLVRWASALILGREALGFGDVTLMAMIGSFLGWQATLCVFLLAPLCGIFVALASWIFTGRSFVPYGPYLGLAALIVMFSWRWLWEPLKWTFGDWQSLAILGAIAIAALVVMLGVLRMYWSIPVESHRRSSQTKSDAE